jgi:hypothetical protein
MYNDIAHQIAGAERGSTGDIKKVVMIYIDGDPDIVGCDFDVDANDRKGMAITREYCRQMKEHFKTLQDGR